MANPKIEVEIGAKTSEFQRKFGEVDSTLKKTGKEFSVFGEFAKGALLGIASAVSVQAIIGIGKAVLETTAQFQKFEAVLANTLGSNSAAQLALIQIQDFASKTPFSVAELTESFVKLANQGFKPTVAELTSLGDLASSTGKSFDQLAEAILDASTGEFERLKEFGIRAKKEGDNVTFTFKGVETQVKATDTAIRGYVLSLGDAEGVSGSMASISETLGGKLSNLGDNIDQLKLAIGDQTSGVFAASIDWLNEFIEVATLAAKKVSDIRKEVMVSGDAQVFSEERKQVDILVQSLSKTLPIQDAINRAVDLTIESYRNLSDDISKGFVSGGFIGAQKKDLEAYRLELLKTKETTEESTLTLEAFGKTQDAVNKKFFADGKLAFDTYNSGLEETIRLQSSIESFSQGIVSEKSNINPFSGIQEFGNLAGESAPITEFADSLDSEKVRLISIAEELSNAFGGVGSAIASAFNKPPAFGQFIGTFLAFAAKLVAANFTIAGSNAVVAATSSAVATGPAAAITLPAFIAGALGVVGSAFAAFKGGGGGGGGGSVGSGVSGQSFTGGGVGGLGGGTRELTGELVVRGNDLVYVLGQSQNKITKG